MNLLTMERIKLFSTRSPYWCLAAIALAGISFGALISLISLDGTQFASTGSSQAGMGLGMAIFLVLGALAVTTEYRFGTIRTTFLAAPRRIPVFAAKTIVIMVLGALIALVTSFLSFFLVKVFADDPDRISLETGADWRMVVGNAAVYALAGVIALSIGALVRQSAGAIAILLVWSTLLENLLGLIPYLAQHSVPSWLPFNAGGTFTQDLDMVSDMAGSDPSAAQFMFDGGPTPWQGLAIFAATALVLWVLAATVIDRRDA